MAKRRVGARGRSTVLLVIGIFLLVAVSVIGRRTRGVTAAARLQRLSSDLALLESQRAQLESDITSAASLTRLGAQVQSRLGLHVPNDSQIVFLPRPAPRTGTQRR